PHWGTYDTTAWVNWDRRIVETNPFDDFARPVRVDVTGPLVVDFSRLPNGDPLFETVNLKGDEFRPWGVTMTPDTTNGECTSATLLLNADEVVNRLMPAPASGQ